MAERDEQMSTSKSEEHHPVGKKPSLPYAALPTGVIMRGSEMIARCRSRAMAQRIAWLLNKYGGSKHGKDQQQET